MNNQKKQISQEVIDNQLKFIYKIKSINDDYFNKTGKRKMFFTHTYGCQQNENDTENINGMLFDMGFSFTEDKSNADLILFNTCAVREHAEQRVFGNVGALVHYKRKKPELIIALCGCMMQQEHVAQQIKSKYKHVNMIFGPHAIYKFPENLYHVMIEKKRFTDTEITDGQIAENLPIKRKDTIKAWVPIMSGCNNFCSYCVVPYVRGRERSRLPENILKEISQLIKDGYKDITLLGQNVNSYCKDLNLDYDFSDLLFDINKIEGEYRIRFMTSHPKDATKKLFETIAQCEHIVNHIHLPFQSGSDRILQLMNRKYTAGQYLELIENAKKIIPDVVFTSDVIVGFPTETEEDFNDTLEIIKKVGFDGLYSFIYSKREKTPAANMEGQISKEEKNRRFNILLETQNTISTEYNKQFIGKTVRVLAEGFDEKNKDIMTGRTEGNKIVNFNVGDVLPGMFTDIIIDKAANWALFGKITNKENTDERFN